MNVLLFLHILGAVIFLGNIVTAAFWKIRADIKRDPKFIHHTVKNVMLADFIFTLPGLILIIVPGILMKPFNQDIQWTLSIGLHCHYSCLY